MHRACQLMLLWLSLAILICPASGRAEETAAAAAGAAQPELSLEDCLQMALENRQILKAKLQNVKIRQALRSRARASRYGFREVRRALDDMAGGRLEREVEVPTNDPAAPAVGEDLSCSCAAFGSLPLLTTNR